MKTGYKQRADMIVEAIDKELEKYSNVNGNEATQLLIYGVINAILYLAEVIKEKK